MTSSNRPVDHQGRAPATLALAPAASACGTSGGEESEVPNGSRDGGFSVEAALAELPAGGGPVEGSAVVFASDLVAVGIANGRERPTGSLDLDEVVDWIGPMSGLGESAVFVRIPTLMVDALGDLAGFRDEIGFAVSEVDTVIELELGADSLVLVSGDLSPNGMDNEVAHGVGTIGDGEDAAFSKENRTVARPLGQPLRVGQRDGLVALSPRASAVESWLDSGSIRLSADEDLALAASVLDDRMVVSAVLCRCDLEASGSGIPTAPSISVPFSVLGVGSRANGGEAEIILVYVTVDGAAAAEAAPQVEEVFRFGISLGVGAPFADQFVIESAKAEGRAVVAVIRLASDHQTPAVVLSLLWARETPFVYAS